MHKRLSAVPVLAIALTGLALVACGGSTTAPSGTSGPATSAPTSAPTTAPTATPGPVSITCPTAATINSGLGVNVGAPTQRPTTGNAAGDSGVSCQYESASFKDIVILTVGTGPTPENFFALVEAGEKKAASEQGVTYAVTPVSGIGDRADYVTFARAGGFTEDGILAQTSTAGLVVTVVPAASESQLESFATQLLG